MCAGRCWALTSSTLGNWLQLGWLALVLFFFRSYYVLEEENHWPNPTHTHGTWARRSHPSLPPLSSWNRLYRKPLSDTLHCCCCNAVVSVWCGALFGGQRPIPTPVRNAQALHRHLLGGVTYVRVLVHIFCVLFLIKFCYLRRERKRKQHTHKTTKKINNNIGIHSVIDPSPLARPSIATKMLDICDGNINTREGIDLIDFSHFIFRARPLGNRLDKEICPI